MSGNPKKSAALHEPTPIVTFYSYKGGVGRSMAVLNVASLIASRGFRVLIIDFDLEAPGLSHLIGQEAIPEKDKSARKSPSKQILKPGVVELLADAVLRGVESDLLSKPFPQVADRYTFSYSPPAGLKQHPGAKLSIMPAGRLDEKYSARLDELDLPGLYKEPENSGKLLILRFREILIQSKLYDYILVDSRTGHSDEAGICTRDLADHRMIVSGLNTQNIAGTAAFLRNLRSALVHEKKELNRPDIILSPVPNGEDDLVSLREEKADKEFRKAWQDPQLQISLRIPYHPRLALTEEAYVPAITASPLRNAYLAIEESLLRSLGHTPRKLLDVFRAQVKEGNGTAALSSLRLLVRLVSAPRFPGQAPVDASAYLGLAYNDDFMKQILRLDEALDILRLFVEYNTDSFEIIEAAKQIHELNPAHASEFDQMILKLASLNPDYLGDYANFLTDDRKDHDVAELFYKRAIESDPKHADNLCNYAIFLTDVRKDHDAAEALHQRAIESDPKHANNLGNYAIFLKDIRNEYDTAETNYKRAIEADPKHAGYLGNYAIFLTEVRKDHDAAEALYQRAIEADPKHSNNLGNYGQFLIGRSKIEEGLKHLRSSWFHRNEQKIGNNAEIAYSLWLATLIAGKEEKLWERVFKHFINLGFERHEWNFDAMLAVAEKKLDSADFHYAKCLAKAFLDVAEVAALEKLKRWNRPQPLDPALVNPDGTIRAV